jgi:hypothetical protein
MVRREGGSKTLHYHKVVTKPYTEEKLLITMRENAVLALELSAVRQHSHKANFSLILISVYQIDAMPVIIATGVEDWS